MTDPADFERRGFGVVPEVLTPREVDELLAAGSSPASPPAGRRKAGIRNLLSEVPAFAAVANSPAVRRLAGAVLGTGAFPVRAQLFDKTPETNWKVPWHQDLAIAVAERIEVPGFTGWSVKDGVPHVHPPAGILEQMVTLRLHLDDCGPDHGPLRMLPGSHRGASSMPLPSWLGRTQYPR